MMTRSLLIVAMAATSITLGCASNLPKSHAGADAYSAPKSPESTLQSPGDELDEKPAPSNFDFGATVLEFELIVPALAVRSDQSIEIIFRITNIGQKQVGMSLGPEDALPFVFDGQGSTVWPILPRNAMYEAILRPGAEFELDPGESHEIIYIWNLTNGNGERVWPGDYTVVGRLGHPLYGAPFHEPSTGEYHLRIEG